MIGHFFVSFDLFIVNVDYVHFIVCLFYRCHCKVVCKGTKLLRFVSVHENMVSLTQQTSVLNPYIRNLSEIMKAVRALKHY